jgi:hypothetical protein
VEISDPREQVMDSRMNHCHATAVRQHVAFGDVGSGPAMQARTYRFRIKFESIPQTCIRNF